MATPQDLLISLSRAYALTGTRPNRDPELAEALEDVRETQEALGWLVVQVRSGGLTVHDEVVPDDFGVLGDFRDALDRAGIREIRFQDVMEPEILEQFLRRLDPSQEAETPTPSGRFRGLEGDIGLSFHAVKGPLPGMTGSIRGLFPSEPAEAEGVEDVVTDQGPLEPEAALLDNTPAGRRARSRASKLALPEDLEVMFQAFLQASGPDRAPNAEKLREAEAGLREAKEMGTLANLVEALAGSGEEEPEEEVLALAQEFTTPALASHLVIRLGETQDEDERARYIRISGRLGREMALALADALGEARDRYQRRSFMDALILLGPLGFEVAESMVHDPRWFVARNGVSLLGEIGGEDIVSHLTTTLANADARVRRETVQALTRVGGDDAAMLLFGMLDDPEAEVRAMACRGVGVLKVEKSLKPLMRLLEHDNDEDVQVESLQALGQLGDPWAVTLIEKRALGGLFSKPSREVRIAGYRALAGIGTPHAMKLLEKAAKSSDSGIRTVVESLLAAKD